MPQYPCSLPCVYLKDRAPERHSPYEDDDEDSEEEEGIIHRQDIANITGNGYGAKFHIVQGLNKDTKWNEPVYKNPYKCEYMQLYAVFVVYLLRFSCMSWYAHYCCFLNICSVFDTVCRILCLFIVFIVLELICPLFLFSIYVQRVWQCMPDTLFVFCVYRVWADMPNIPRSVNIRIRAYYPVGGVWYWRNAAAEDAASEGGERWWGGGEFCGDSTASIQGGIRSKTMAVHLWC